MIDNSLYWTYLEKEKKKRLRGNDAERLRVLEQAKFTGRVKIRFGEVTINFHQGGVMNMNENFETGMLVERSVKLKD